MKTTIKVPVGLFKKLVDTQWEYKDYEKSICEQASKLIDEWRVNNNLKNCPTCLGECGKDCACHECYRCKLIEEQVKIGDMMLYDPHYQEIIKELLCKINRQRNIINAAYHVFNDLAEQHFIIDNCDDVAQLKEHIYEMASDAAKQHLIIDGFKREEP